MNNISIFVLVLFLTFACSAPSDILFQDNFETYQVNKGVDTPWKTEGDGMVTIDSSKAFSGKQSVYFKSGEGYSNRAFIQLSNIFPIAGNAYVGEMMMYVKEASPDGIHWTMIQSGGTVANENFEAEIRFGGQHQKQLMANYDTKGVKSDCWQHSAMKIPEGRWFSVKWLFNGPINEMQLWIDDQPVDNLRIKGHGEGCISDERAGQWLFPIMENLSLGWVDYQTGGGKREVWIDDVVVSKL